MTSPPGPFSSSLPEMSAPPSLDEFRLWPMGDAALLVQTTDPEHVLALHAALLARPVPGQLDVVPGARTVLVRVIPGTDLDAVADHLRQLRAAHLPVTERAGREVVIDTVYDGADLAEVGELTGLGAAGVVAAHTSVRWRVAFTGFAPGFGYLTGGDPLLRVRRRGTSRTAVPAGSVGLAGDFTGVYPRVSPGGWQLIGRTEAVLWDTRRNPPALLAPGTWVRFRDASGGESR